MDLFCTMEPTGLPPLIKWAGGKERELPYIFANAPEAFEDYYEPFVGGGSVFAAFPARKYYINDISTELAGLYRCIARRDEGFYRWMKDIEDTWQGMLLFADRHRELCSLYESFREGKLTDEGVREAVSLFFQANTGELDGILSPSLQWHRDAYARELHRSLTSKLLRMRKIESERQLMPEGDVFLNIETALQGAVYMYFRCLYNDGELMGSEEALGVAMFVFVRNYAYSGMFRYNARGGFNVPYGGMGYNRKSLEGKLSYYQSERLARRFRKTSVCNLDFEAFLRANPPGERDFVFVDPPYDSTFSTYARNAFTEDDQRRLARYLISECRGQWMLVIKNTPLIRSLYADERLTVKSFDKTYQVSFMNRNDKRAEHLIVTNYSPPR